MLKIVFSSIASLVYIFFIEPLCAMLLVWMISKAVPVDGIFSAIVAVGWWLPFIIGTIICYYSWGVLILSTTKTSAVISCIFYLVLWSFAYAKHYNELGGMNVFLDTVTLAMMVNSIFTSLGREYYEN